MINLFSDSDHISPNGLYHSLPKNDDTNDTTFIGAVALIFIMMIFIVIVKSSPKYYRKSELSVSPPPADPTKIDRRLITPSMQADVLSVVENSDESI